MAEAPDPRLTPARADLAAAHLRGTVQAPRYVSGRPMHVTVPVLDLLGRNDPGASLASQLLHGEGFCVYDEDPATGLAWGQSDLDGYVGYVPRDGLGAGALVATHQVVTRTAQVYARPELKSRPVQTLPFLARLAASDSGPDHEPDSVPAPGPDHMPAPVPDRVPDPVSDPGPDHLRIDRGRHVPRPQVAALGALGSDPVVFAMTFLGAPYLWGGRSALGLDCSALVQLAFQAIGRALPRDSDQQQRAGKALEGPPRRGDLVFWRGHVGILEDAETLIHANAHHMAVVREPLSEAVARIAASGGGAVTAMRRI